ncbi:oxidoreductase [Georgenia halophila]|uniref:Oxidoreductase n=1 Tax=Georgenia halophila TaxID=620889 RepID=A0ABP8L6M3_9MICO
MTREPEVRTALVTGASTGIGARTASRLVDAGYRVFGTSRRGRGDHDGVQMLQMDVRDDESVREAVGAVTEAAGHIDILVNNAGVAHQGFAEETGRAEADAVFETNFFGPIRVTDAVLPQMRRRRSGRVINVGSLAAWIGEPGETMYAASKAALARYSEALRHEVWHLGISVSLVEPGAFTTGVLGAASGHDDHAGHADHTGHISDYDGPRELARRTLEKSLRHGGDPNDVADLIAAVARTGQPRSRYGVGREARRIPIVKAAVPQRLTDYLLRRAYQLPGRSITSRS